MSRSLSEYKNTLSSENLRQKKVYSIYVLLLGVPLDVRLQTCDSHRQGVPTPRQWWDPLVHDSRGGPWWLLNLTPITRSFSDPPPTPIECPSPREPKKPTLDTRQKKSRRNLQHTSSSLGLGTFSTPVTSVKPFRTEDLFGGEMFTPNYRSLYPNTKDSRNPFRYWKDPESKGWKSLWVVRVLRTLLWNRTFWDCVVVLLVERQSKEGESRFVISFLSYNNGKND